MKASASIVGGSFHGGDIEPGTFHHWIPPELQEAPSEQAAPAVDSACILLDAPGTAPVPAASPAEVNRQMPPVDEADQST